MGVDEAFRSFLPDGGAFPVRLGVRGLQLGNDQQRAPNPLTLA